MCTTVQVRTVAAAEGKSSRFGKLGAQPFTARPASDNADDSSL
jgi:hypothetical protein